MRKLGRPPQVLVYGKDGRSVAIISGLKASSRQPELFLYSDFMIPGLGENCKVLRGSLEDVDEMVECARKIRPDLIVIGPEEPLQAKLVDRLEKLGIPCFGPHSELARIETSKAWARSLLDRRAIPGNPRYRIFSNEDGLRAYLKELGDFVVKPDGLTGGKGVKVLGEHLESLDDAYGYSIDVIGAHRKVVIEERLEGEEFSLQTITDGEAIVHCPLVQDHKRARPGDRGENTGGMGSYSCSDFSLPFLDPDDVAQAKSINKQVIAALAEETSRPYRGVLYGGFIATSDGIRLIEYNARFGDPEAMNVLPLLETDLLDLCESVAQGRLSQTEVRFHKKATVCKYVVPESYPDKKSSGDPIEVPTERLTDPNLRYYWAAVEERDSRIVLTGSRAIAFVGIADDLAEAERRAEAGASSVKGNVRHRKDIGTRETVQRRIDHMLALRNRR